MPAPARRTRRARRGRRTRPPSRSERGRRAESGRSLPGGRGRPGTSGGRRGSPVWVGWVGEGMGVRKRRAGGSSHARTHTHTSVSSQGTRMTRPGRSSGAAMAGAKGKEKKGESGPPLLAKRQKRQKKKKTPLTNKAANLVCCRCRCVKKTKRRPNPQEKKNAVDPPLPSRAPHTSSLCLHHTHTLCSLSLSLCSLFTGSAAPSPCAATPSPPHPAREAKSCPTLGHGTHSPTPVRHPSAGPHRSAWFGEGPG